MQNPNHERGDKQPGKGRYIWLIIAGLLLLLLIILYLRVKPEKPVVNPDELAFNPLGGTTINDTLGNDDGQLNPGEQVKVQVRLTNAGERTLPAFALLLAARQSGVTFINNDNRVQFKSSEPGQTILSDDFFEFKLSENYLLDCVGFDGKIERALLAGFVSNAYAQGGSAATLGIDMYVYPNFRVCLGEATLTVGPTAATAAVLTIDVALCNSSASVLDDARVTIEPGSVKTCSATSPTFITLTPGGIPMNSFDYGDVGANQCGEPADTNPVPPGTEFIRYQFSATPLLPAATVETMCIYLGVKIFRGDPAVLVGERNMGIRARVNRRQLPPG